MIFSGFFLQILAGVWVTIQVALCALLLGLLLGLIGATAEASKVIWLRYMAVALISIIRGLPELLVIFFVYFGGTLLLTQLAHHYVNVSAFLLFSISLTFIV